jgi:hypothetical protein
VVEVRFPIRNVKFLVIENLPPILKRQRQQTKMHDRNKIPTVHLYKLAIPNLHTTAWQAKETEFYQCTTEQNRND